MLHSQLHSESELEPEPAPVAGLVLFGSAGARKHLEADSELSVGLHVGAQ